jgi:acetyl/propionyl-CoA carboxylase alpha subunit
MARAVIRRLLVANRGEIAIRIARGARELGIEPVGIYSDADAHALHREAMARSLRIGAGPASESYLDIAKIVDAARALEADAVHPGYGFLSERAEFAQAVLDAGLIFVGPSPAAIAAMGDKSEAKRRMRAAGIPVIPGYDGDDQTDATLRAQAERIGTPLVIKARAGGGGRGMRVVSDLGTFEAALASARREAQAAFGDAGVLLERYLVRPRHVEVQILGDLHGNVVHLGERECSIQRRHQKVVEEAPSSAVDEPLRARLGGAAVAAARAANYTNAGTVEFLLDGDGTFAFIEVNARLQVEHPVTELVYGVDLVHEQLRIAAGEPLRFAQADLRPRGWAIEARLVAEDPHRDDLPQTGTIARFDVPPGPGVRVDAGVRDGSEISPFYDSLVAKIIVAAEDRPAAVARLAATLAATRILGVQTNLALLTQIARDPAFARGDTTTAFLAELAARTPEDSADVTERTRRAAPVAAAALAAGGYGWRLAGLGIPVDLHGTQFTVDRIPGGWRVHGDGTMDVPDDRIARDAAILSGNRVAVADGGADLQFTVGAPPSARAEHAHTAAGDGTVVAPMPGKIAAIAVAPGGRVAAGELLLVLEAMKMEHRITAPSGGTVERVAVAVGDVVAGGAELVRIGASADG